MPTRNEWRELIRGAADSRPSPVTATTFLEHFGSSSRPIKVIADDGRIYLVKGRQNGRMIVNEQIVAMLGEELQAPVASVAFVDVTQSLISAEPNMQHMQVGVSHGSLWLDNCTDRQSIAYTNVVDNRSRFAALAGVYSWVQANDHQWIYSRTSPNLVYSVDHGHFFPGGPNWTVNGLRNAGDLVIDPVFQPCDLRPDDYAPLLARLKSITTAAIAAAVARPWPDWQFTENERIDVAAYLDNRRPKLIEALEQL